MARRATTTTRALTSPLKAPYETPLFALSNLYFQSQAIREEIFEAVSNFLEFINFAKQIGREASWEFIIGF